MASIKSITINGTNYSIGGTSGSNSLKVNLGKTAHQTLYADIVYPSKIAGGNTVDVRSVILNITLEGHPGYKPGTIIIDGKDTGKTVYSTTAVDGLNITASEPELQDKLPFILQLASPTNSTTAAEYTVTINKAKGTLQWSYTNDITTASNKLTSSSGTPISLSIGGTEDHSTAYIWGGISDNFGMTNWDGSVFSITKVNDNGTDTQLNIKGDLSGLINLSGYPLISYYGPLQSMFQYVTTLPLDASDLQTKLYVEWCNYNSTVGNHEATGCYEMFANSSLIKPPKTLPATKLCSYCYRDMFRNTSITVAPDIPEFELFDASTDTYYNLNLAFSGMFSGCKHLVNGPTIYQKSLNLDTHPELIDGYNSKFYQIFDSMFYGCTSLQSVTCYYNVNELDNIVVSNKYENVFGLSWFPNNTATFYKRNSVDWSSSGVIPSTWTIKDIE